MLQKRPHMIHPLDFGGHYQLLKSDLQENQYKYGQKFKLAWPSVTFVWVCVPVLTNLLNFIETCASIQERLKV